jgi:aromatic ring-cleaving dioxygenase
LAKTARHAPIKNYHAHVYYDAATRKLAQKLCDAAAKKFGVKIGRMHDKPVGPHPRGSCQITVEPERFAELIPWLIQNRGKLTIFAHAQTGDALKDHTDHVIWFGQSERLDLSQFKRR